MGTPTNPRLIFIHGLLSSGQSYKANLLRGHFPNILTPDFVGSLEERLAQLESILSDRAGWVIIGSSFGGLMGAMFTCQHPTQVNKLILLAPARSASVRSAPPRFAPLKSACSNSAPRSLAWLSIEL